MLKEKFGTPKARTNVGVGHVGGKGFNQNCRAAAAAKCGDMCFKYFTMKHNEVISYASCLSYKCPT
eukprot:9357166-Pyramimonas_sp.AAC.1